MMNTREDSVLTSIKELQHLEDERTREIARRAEDAERARLAKLEAARIEAQRVEAERIARIESERVAELAAKERAERAEREAREASEIALRSEAERERDRRVEERREAHARAMAEIEARSNAGVRAPTVVAIALGVFAAIGAGGYFGVWRPMEAAHDARVAALRAQTDRAAQERDAARAAQQSLEARMHDLGSRPVTPIATTSVPPARGVAATTPRRGRATTSASGRTNNETVIDIDGENVDFGMDDGARAAPARRPRR